jgi:hypothetical protein
VNDKYFWLDSYSSLMLILAIQTPNIPGLRLNAAQCGEYQSETRTNA